MNAGAAVARGNVLLFLHADTRLPDNADAFIRDALARSGRVWGRFDVRFDRGGLLTLIAFAMNLRSRLTGIATGDQALFVTRAAFGAIGGFPSIPLMEDVELSKALRRSGKTVLLRKRVRTSGRRWEAWGPLRTIFRMWRLRLGFLLGMTPERCAELYLRRPFPVTRRSGRAPRSSAGG